MYFKLLLIIFKTIKLKIANFLNKNINGINQKIKRKFHKTDSNQQCLLLKFWHIMGVRH